MKQAYTSRRSPSQESLSISVINRCHGLRMDRRLLVKAVRLVAGKHHLGAGQVEIIILPNEEIAKLNRQFLKHRGSTDVICFDLNAQSSAETSRKRSTQISMALGGQVARRQARNYRSSINKELTLYTIHGLLHTQGFDDSHPQKARQMHQYEDQLLQLLGFRPVFSKNSLPR